MAGPGRKKKGGGLLFQERSTHNSSRDSSAAPSVASGATSVDQNGPPWLPKLQYSISFPKQHRNGAFYDAAFCPFILPNEGQILAVCRNLEVLVYRVTDGGAGLETLHCWEDEDRANKHSQGEEICSLCWAQDPGGEILLLAAGQAKNIKVLDPISGKHLRTLTGHGGDVQMMKHCPSNPTLIASCARDNSIRIWTMDPAYAHQPCAAIIGGIEGHREILYSLAWHPSGKYLLSGGMDSIINLWAIPILPNEKTGTDRPTVIQYPHFSSMNIHSNYIDSLFFLGDTIVSKAAVNNEIHLWRICNFDSRLPVPPYPTTIRVRNRKDTRSVWADCEGEPGYERLIRFGAKDTQYYFMRFGVSPDGIIAMGTSIGTILFWSLHDIANQPAHLTQDAIHNIFAWDEDYVSPPPEEEGEEEGEEDDEEQGEESPDVAVDSSTPTTVPSTYTHPSRTPKGDNTINRPPEQPKLTRKGRPARPRDKKGNEKDFESQYLTDPFSLLLPGGKVMVPGEKKEQRETQTFCITWSPCRRWMAAAMSNGRLAVYRVPDSEVKHTV